MCLHHTFIMSIIQHWHCIYFVKMECHANENALKKSEKIWYVGQSLMYAIIKNKYLTMLVFVLNAIKLFSFLD